MSLWRSGRTTERGRASPSTPALAAWILLAALLQAELAGFRAPGFRRPDLPLALAVAFAFGLPRRKALVGAFFAGLAQDLLSCCALGWNTALNLLAVIGVATVRSQVFADSPPAQALLGLAAGVAKGVAGWLAVRALGGGPTFAQAWWGIVGGGLACAALTPVFVWVVGGDPRLTASASAEGRVD